MRRALVLAIAAACGDNEPPRDPFAIEPLIDTNADPNIVEVTLVAMVGRFEYVSGVPVPNQYDGSEHTQTPVAPGETFDYVFTATRARDWAGKRAARCVDTAGTRNDRARARDRGRRLAALELSLPKACFWAASRPVSVKTCSVRPTARVRSSARTRHLVARDSVASLCCFTRRRGRRWQMLVRGDFLRGESL